MRKLSIEEVAELVRQANCAIREIESATHHLEDGELEDGELEDAALALMIAQDILDRVAESIAAARD